MSWRSYNARSTVCRAGDVIIPSGLVICLEDATNTDSDLVGTLGCVVSGWNNHTLAMVCAECKRDDLVVSTTNVYNPPRELTQDGDTIRWGDVLTRPDYLGDPVSVTNTNEAAFRQAFSEGFRITSGYSSVAALSAYRAYLGIPVIGWCTSQTPALVRTLKKRASSLGNLHYARPLPLP